MAKILIVGCGDIGSKLARLLADTGHEVVATRRHSFELQGVQAMIADVTQPQTLLFPAGLDYVFVVLAPNESSEAAYRAVYFEGTKNVLAALQGQAIKRIFWVSSSSVYGQDAGEWVDEDSPAEPSRATAKVLRETEIFLKKAIWPVTVVRFAGIYGPGRNRLLKWVQEARPVQAEPPQWTNRIHVDDCAGLLVFLMGKDRAGVALEPIYLGVDSKPVPQHEILGWLAAEMKLPKVEHETRSGASMNKRLSNKRILALGYEFHYPDFQAGYRMMQN